MESIKSKIQCGIRQCPCCGSNGALVKAEIANTKGENFWCPSCHYTGISNSLLWMKHLLYYVMNDALVQLGFQDEYGTLSFPSDDKLPEE